MDIVNVDATQISSQREYQTGLDHAWTEVEDWVDRLTAGVIFSTGHDWVQEDTRVAAGLGDSEWYLDQSLGYIMTEDAVIVSGVPRFRSFFDPTARIADWFYVKPTSFDADARSRLGEVNSYFKSKAADVLSDEKAVDLLGKLYESDDRSLRYRDEDISSQAAALAKLAAAGFCAVGLDRARITDAGYDFITAIKEN